jgi:hypothetical protein
VRSKKFKIKSKLFKWSGEAAWYFIKIDEKTTEDIKNNFGMMARGWGSLPVNVKLGSSEWKTSIFPDRKTNYLLPIKSKVRKAEKINDGDLVSLTMEIIVDRIEIKPPNLN